MMTECIEYVNLSYLQSAFQKIDSQHLISHATTPPKPIPQSAAVTLKPGVTSFWGQSCAMTNPLKNVYTAAGFSLHSESSVGYCYTDLVKRYHRY
jgi:hypothetical protein